MNQYLVPRMLRRSLHSVKGTRQFAEYRNLPPAVNAAAEVVRVDLAPDDDAEANVPAPDHLGDMRTAVSNWIEELDWQRLGYEGARLAAIAKGVLNGKSAAESVLAWLRDILPVPNRQRSNRWESGHNASGQSASKRVLRRREYTEV